jgi:uncharacterized protein (TIGR01777 family)
MRIAVAGATGFIGRHLSDALRQRGDDVVAVSLRDVSAAAAQASTCPVVVNVSGEPVSQRWTARVKQRIEESRVDVPRRFIDALARNPSRPAAYISASAIGYYGHSETETFTESSPPGSDFLARVCVGWEREALRAAEVGMRVAIVRTGLALGVDGGALPKLLPPFKIGAGGAIGRGTQWVSWVHIDDLVQIYLRAIDGATGIFNATAPNPVTNAEFVRSLGQVLHRPAAVRTPAIVLRAALGEGAEMLLRGQRVLPERTLGIGYTFIFEKIDAALSSLFAKPL